MKDLLGEKRELAAVEVLLSMVISRSLLTMRKDSDRQLGFSPDKVLIEIKQEFGTIVDGIKPFYGRRIHKQLAQDCEYIINFLNAKAFTSWS